MYQEFSSIRANCSRSAGRRNHSRHLAIELLDERSLLTTVVMDTPDFRISEAGGTGARSQDAESPAIAYNAIDDQYLIVWSHEDQSQRDTHSGIVGQIVDAQTHRVIRDDFRISAPRDVGRAQDPAVAWNSQTNEYMVIWAGDRGTDTERVLMQRIGGDGRFRGGQIPINDPIDGGSLSGVSEPAVTYNSTSGEYLAVWGAFGDGLGSFTKGILGQLIDATGKEVGSDFRISDVGGDGNVFRIATAPDVVVNEQSGDFLVVWAGNADKSGELLQLTEAVFGQFVDAKGNEIGSNDFPISNGIELSESGRVAQSQPEAVYNSHADSFLVAFNRVTRDADGRNAAKRVFGRIINATGAPQTAKDFAIGDDLDDTGFISEFDVAYNSLDNEFLVVWVGDIDSSSVRPIAIEEVYAQRLDSFGAEIGESDFFVSDIQSDRIGFVARSPAAVWNSATNDYFAVWSANDMDPEPLSSGEFEVFGRTMQLVGNTTEQETIFVTTAEDEIDGNLSPNDTSLREAILLANGTPSSDTIVIDSQLAGQSIDLQFGPLPTGNSPVDESSEFDLRIVGLGADRSTINAQGESRIFTIAEGRRVELSGMTLTGGSEIQGGAILTHGDLTLDGLAIRDSNAGEGGAVHVHLTGGLTVSNSEFSGNSANDGGAIMIFGQTFSAINTTFSGNSALRSGGALAFPLGQGRGGTIINSTITNNTANADSEILSHFGGGIVSRAGADVVMHNTIVAGNFVANDDRDNPLLADDVAGSLDAASSHNLIGVVSRMTGVVNGQQGNQVGTTASPLDPLLGQLSNNGGPTQTHALLEGSLAIDRGAEVDSMPSTDQRGESFTRVIDGDGDGTARADIGAVEFLFNTPSRIVGDVNGDGRFDTSDLISILQSGEFEDGIDGNSTFEEGDWNGDGEFDKTDIILALQEGRFERN